MEKLSFSNVVDNFLKNTYEIIDEIVILLKEYNNQSFTDFVNKFIDIFTKGDRELSVGFIFICIGILIYFLFVKMEKNTENLKFLKIMPLNYLMYL